MEILNCISKHQIFRNIESGYTVFSAKYEENYFREIEFTVTGIFTTFSENKNYILEGEWKTHQKYGRQFCASSYSEPLPITAKGIENYLSSGLIEGIGKTYASLIVAQFGDKTIDIIENEPERLREVYGIGKKRAASIIKSCKEQKEIRDIMIFLKEYNVPNKLAIKIYTQYGLKSIKILKTDPYQIAEDISGIGFIKADEIARNLGIDLLDEHRIQAGLLYVLEQSTDMEGHTFLLKETLIKRASDILKIKDSNIIEKGIKKIKTRKKIVIEGEAIYLFSYHYSERMVAFKITQLLESNIKDDEPSNKMIIECEKECGITFTNAQTEAIKTAIKSNFSVMTGGPGTGKTTTTKGIISVLKMMGKNILLAAPTGRAAKRISEVTGEPAQTIHKMLGMSHEGVYTHDIDNPIEGDVLIVDESSMIDIKLMCHLMDAVPYNMKVILIGDVDQLPSVGAGDVLKDIIKSQVVPVIRLTKIFRQAEQSPIIRNAHCINNGHIPELDLEWGREFVFLEADGPENIQHTIVNCVTNLLPTDYNINSDEVQILCPQRTMACGTNAINHAIQSHINPNKEKICRTYEEIHPGDKVIQIKNNYEKDVMNGELGIVNSVNPNEGTLTVRFDLNDVEYDSSDMNELLLAYAITVHRSQGSEYKAVIIPVSKAQTFMLQRSLLYTAVTRAKELCVLVGDREAIANAVHNNLTHKRNSNLDYRLKNNFE